MTAETKVAEADRISLLRNVHSLQSLDVEILKDIANSAEQKCITRGDALILEGDQADTLYIVLKGRFVVMSGAKPIAEISTGEPIGELAFFSGGARTATVIAARNSTVLCLTRHAYNALAQRTPELPNAILKAVSERLARSIPDQPVLRPRAGKVCSVFPGGQTSMDPRFVDGLKAAFTVHSNWTILDETDCPAPDISHDKLTAWMEDQETRCGNLVILSRSPQDVPNWHRVAAEMCDTVLIAVQKSEGSPDIAASALEKSLLDATLPSNIQLALYRDGASETTRETGPWLAERNVALHHHIALDAQTDFDRLGRFIRGEALGLVLCGGGSFGTAHLGALRALQDHGYVFDQIGGTSVGAAMGAALAIGLDPTDVMDFCEDIFIKSKAMSRLTVPKHSLLDHHTLDAALQHHYRGYTIEDLPLNFFANATSLTNNDVHVIRRGPMWQAVRASTALPGIFPPFLCDDGKVLIDGGLLDNVPVSAMRSLKAGPNLLLNFQPTKPWRVQVKYDDLPTRAQALAGLVRPKRKGAARLPSVTAILSRSMVVNARKLMKEIDLEDDILMNISTLRGMSYLDWKRGRELFDAAYKQMSVALERSTDLGESDEMDILCNAANLINS